MFSIRALLLLIILFVADNSLSQIKPVSIHALDSLMTAEAKPTLILLSTEWCQYCQMQKVQMQKNKVEKSVADQFYYVEFDAESKETVTVNGNTYSYKPTGLNLGIHEFAQRLNGNKKLIYPTWILLNQEQKILFRHQGALLSKDLNRLFETIVKTN